MSYRTFRPPSQVLTLRLSTMGLLNRDIEIRQGDAVTGLSLQEARQLLALLPGVIESMTPATVVPVACAHGIDYLSSAPPTNRSPKMTDTTIANRNIICATLTHGGATFTTDGHDLMGSPFYAVALMPGDDMVADDISERALDLFRQRFAVELRYAGVIGTWERGDGKFVYDVVEVLTDRAEAIRRGFSRGQDGIFDLRLGETISTTPEATK